MCRVLKKFVLWLRGYLLLTLQGMDIERFLNLCNVKEIKVWGLVHRNGSYHCYMKLSDYKQIRPVAKKTKVVPYIEKRYGFPFTLQQGRKRKGFVLGIIIFCSMVYILSLYIWDIKVEGGYKHTEDELLRYLESIKVYSGSKISQVDCPMIEESLRREFTDISWVSAEILGTQLIVRIVETSLPSLEQEKLGTNLTQANMVATKNAIIVGIVTRKGMPKVEIGSIVRTGDVLISGIVPVIGDNETLIENKLVVAEGNILCRTYYEYKDEFPVTYKERKYTGESTTGYELYLFGRKIISYSPSNSYEHCDIISEVNTLKLVRNFYLPIRYIRSKTSEYQVFKASYTQEEAYEIANKRLLRYLENLKNNGATIIENQVVMTIDNNRLEASGKIIVEEAAGKYEEISNDWRNSETDEYSGNNN